MGLSTVSLVGAAAAAVVARKRRRLGYKKKGGLYKSIEMSCDHHIIRSELLKRFPDNLLF